MIEAVLFDLDYTLYDASEFYLGAFETMATTLGERHGRDPAELQTLLTTCWRELTSGHPRLFDEVLRRAGLPPEEVPSMVRQLHAHAPARLTLYPDADRVLTALRSTHAIGIVTDGHAITQRSKLNALGLPSRVDVVVVTDEHGPGWGKPSPLPFRAALDALGVEPAAAVFIGDNPRVDAGGPAALGMMALRLRRGEYAESEDPDQAPFTDELDSLDDLVVRWLSPRR